MTDPITDTLRDSMRQVVDMAPEAPALPAVAQYSRRARSGLALVGGFAAVILTVGVAAFALTRPTQEVAGSTDLTHREIAFAELEEAAHSATQCIEDLGAETRPPVYHDDSATFSFTMVADGSLQSEAEACIEELFEPTNAEWMAAYGPVPTPEPHDEATTTHATNETTTTNPPDNDPQSVADIAELIGARPITQNDLELKTGLTPRFATNGYELNRITIDTETEIGLILYNDPSERDDGGGAYACIYDYALISGVSVIGGAQCAPTLDRAIEMATSGATASGSCGPVPKEDPQVDGVWTLFSSWGIPDGVDTVRVTLSNDEEETIDVASTRVAQKLWNESISITAISYDGDTIYESPYPLSQLPIQGIDCAPGSDGQG